MNVILLIALPILIDAIISAFWAFIGYLASNDPDNITWNWQEFGESILIGALVGAVASYLKISVLDATNLLASVGVPLAIHRLIKLVLNRKVQKLAAQRLNTVT